VQAGGGLAALKYVFRKGREAGGLLTLYSRLRSKNACKTCALGMGGRRGGMVNEAGHFPEVCKKSIQAQVSDMSAAAGDDLFARTPLEAMAGWSPARFEKLGRLTFPLFAGPGDRHFRRIDWSEALERAGEHLRAADPKRVFFYLSGRSSNEAGFLLQMVARAYGSEHVNNCSYYCHTASGVALSSVYGSGTASVVLDDLERADLALVAGANPASNHPRLITALMKIRRRGGRVIVVNPMRELGLVRFRVPSDWRSFLFGSRISDLYLQPHIGGDVAVFKALLKAIVEAGGVDQDFVRQYVSGWPDVLADIQEARWDDLLAASGLDREAIERCAAMIVEAKRGILLWAMGLTHHAHGVDNILALANLALSRGWLGRPGTGMLPIRGHSNVQGIASVGAGPKLEKAFAEAMLKRYGIEPSKAAGFDTFASMCAAERGEIDASIQLGGNLYASNPDLRWASRALARIPMTISLTTSLNQGHVLGRGRMTLVLPVLARDEEEQATTQESMFNYVRLSSGGRPAVGGEMRSEVEIIAALAERILPAGRFEWSELRSHQALRRAMAEVVPGYRRLAEIDSSGNEFQIDGRTFHLPVFATADGKAHMHVTPLPDLEIEPGCLRLMTVRSEGQFNTVVYDEEDLYRGNTRRDVLMMSRQDAEVRSLVEGQRVVVRSSAGEMAAGIAIVDIRPGNVAMYFPEANVLVPRVSDRRSKTPAFKGVSVSITPARDSRSDP